VRGKETARGTEHLRSALGRVQRRRGLLGWFNMGSTVIVLLPPGACDLDGDLQRATQVVMGRPIATLRNLSP